MKYKEIHFEKIDSTNKYIKNNYQLLDDLVFVSASYQTNGKGRNEHRWISKSNKNLLFSFLIKDKKILLEYKLLSFVFAYVFSNLLEKEYKLKPLIKWPNDIFVNNKKISGILLEGDINSYIVIGMGINVNQKRFNTSFNYLPTSISNEINKEIDINKLKEILFNNILKEIHNIKNNKNIILNYINNHNYLLNKEVSFNLNNKINSGIVKKIDSNYNLVIDINGQNILVSSGEINLLSY